MQIRPYHPDDLETIREITVEAFDGVSIDQGMEHKYGLINGRDWRWRKRRHIDEDVRRDPEGIFILDDNGKIAGLITTWQDTEAGIGHIPNLALRPEYRGQGLGRRLLEHALDRFRNSGLRYAKIETLEQNDTGNHLYRSLGFREVARQIHFAADLNANEQT